MRTHCCYELHLTACNCLFQLVNNLDGGSTTIELNVRNEGRKIPKTVINHIAKIAENGWNVMFLSVNLSDLNFAYVNQRKANDRMKQNKL